MPSVLVISEASYVWKVTSREMQIFVSWIILKHWVNFQAVENNAQKRVHVKQFVLLIWEARLLSLILSIETDIYLYVASVYNVGHNSLVSCPFLNVFNFRLTFLKTSTFLQNHTSIPKLCCTLIHDLFLLILRPSSFPLLFIFA